MNVTRWVPRQDPLLHRGRGQDTRRISGRVLQALRAQQREFSAVERFDIRNATQIAVKRRPYWKAAAEPGEGHPTTIRGRPHNTRPTQPVIYIRALGNRVDPQDRAKLQSEARRQSPAP